MKFLKSTADPAIKYDMWEVRVRIFGVTSHPGAGQELQLCYLRYWNYPEASIVEYFGIGGNGHEWHDDVHIDMRGAARSMKLFPSAVEGADVSQAGFAMLSANEDGSVVHTPPTWIPFNRAHLSQHQVGGVLAKTDRSRTIDWSIVSDDDGVHVTIDGRAAFYPARV